MVPFSRAAASPVTWLRRGLEADAVLAVAQVLPLEEVRHAVVASHDTSTPRVAVGAQQRDAVAAIGAGDQLVLAHLLDEAVDRSGQRAYETPCSAVESDAQSVRGDRRDELGALVDDRASRS